MPAPIQPESITSAANPAVKLLRSLETKKGRAETGLFLAEGARLVEQAFARGWQPALMAVSQGGLGRAYMPALMLAAAKAGARIIALPDRLIASITHKDNPQTVIAAFRQREFRLEDLARDGPGLWLSLFEVRDPGNLGTIIRTADCAGVAGLVLIGQCCDLYSVETVRATMGSLFDLKVARTDFAGFDAWRRTLGLSLTAASVNATTRHDRVDYGARAAIIMGNEQAGLPDAVEAACDTLALIPMRGGADSLNLAQASAIMVYEAWRQRDFAGAR